MKRDSRFLQDLEIMTDSIVGTAVFCMFSGYDINPSIDNIKLVLSAAEADILERARRLIPGFLMRRCNFYMNNESEVMKWQI